MNFFRKGKFLYIPTSSIGYMLWIIAAGFLVTVFITVDRDSNSVSDTLYGIFPYFASTFLLIEWFASKTTN
jgi:hypothetical protein